MMSSISAHISKLLFDHECVILPGFGALITRYYPAEINPGTRMMRPPSRRVSFNSRISENDGLLASHISKMESCEFREAMKSISREVKSWQEELNSGRKVNLPGIGRFYLDTQSKVQFSPSIDINYHKASFGLSIFRAPALQREVEIRQDIDKAIEKEVAIPLKKKNTTPAYRKWAAVIAPFIALGIAAGIYLDQNNYQVLDRASILPFGSNATEEVTDKAKILPASITEPVVDREEGIDLPEEAPVKVEERTTPEASYKSSYHIVVGSFKDKENALHYVKDLQNRGFQAYITEGDKEFNRVSIDNFTTREEAVDELLRIKSVVNPGAWIYSN